jgi:hypothetical protein
LNSASEFAEKVGFVSGHRFSDAVTPAKSDAPLGAACRNLTFSANCSAAEVTLFGWKAAFFSNLLRD